MGKPIQQGKKPPYFRECPICHKEFGSRSLEIHMSRCLERQKSNSDQESDAMNSDKSPTKAKVKAVVNSPLKIKGVKAAPKGSKKVMTSDDDDEVETSLSDELNLSWPSKAAPGSKARKTNLTRTISNKNRRKRERKKDMRSNDMIVNSSGDEDHSRPKTATLKRPHVLDESLKDKVDMTLTKKEFLAAVKLCSDAAVQRGLPNMRMKAAKAQSKVYSTKQVFQQRSQSPSSPYMSKIIGKIMGRRKVSPDKVKIVERPKTTKLERPTIVDLPHIHVKPQHVISSRLSRHLKTRMKKTIDETTKAESDIRHVHQMGKQPSPKSNAAALSMPKDKVPEPCRSCGRSDFPERLHTHNNNSITSSKIPLKTTNHESPTKRVIPTNNVQQQQQPWLSPKSSNHRRQRALSLDTTVIEPLTLESGEHNSSKKELKKLNAKTNASSSLQIVDISDEVTNNSDVEMFSWDSETDKGVIVSEINLLGGKKLAPSNKEARIDDMSNDSSSSDIGVTSTSAMKKFKRPPPPPKSINKSNEKTVPETTDSADSSDNNNLLGLVKCLVCGKQFGKNSIKFHVPQCQRKQQLIKDRQEALEEKKNANYITEENEAEPVPYIHEAIWEAHVQQLIPCKICGRTFFPDRIEVHQKSCKGVTVKVSSTGASLLTSSLASGAPGEEQSSLEFLMKNSPLIMRRTLHSQDDTVISTLKYEDSS